MLMQIYESEELLYKFLGAAVVKNGHGTLISMNRSIQLADFLHANSYKFKKAKSYLNGYWVGMVKYGCVLLGRGTPPLITILLKNPNLHTRK